MNSNDFFITLESNADLQNHPDNTQNKFKVTLESPIELQGEWETGLAQFIFPHSWHEKLMKETANNHNMFAIKLHIDGDGGNDETQMAYWRDLYLEPLDYHTIKDLLEAMRRAIDFNTMNAVSFIFKGKVGEHIDPEHIRINPTKAGSKLALNLQLASLLSFNLEKIKKEKWKDAVTIKRLYGGIGIEWLVIMRQHQSITSLAERQYLPAPISQDITIKARTIVQDMGLFQNMYINSDLVEPQYIGNTRSNVLRIIAPTMMKGAIETFNFDPIFYIPLRVTKFNTAEINITGDTGQLIPFDGGVVVAVLHLRRKHNILV